MGLYKRKDSSFWWIKKTTNGKTHYQSTKTTKKTEAQEIYLDFLERFRNRIFKYRNKTWKNLVDYYAHNYSKNDHRFLTWTMRYWEDKKLSEFTNEDIIDRQEFRLLRVNAATCNRNFNIVRALLRRAERDLNWIAKTPHVKKYKECNRDPVILTREDQRRLLWYLPPHLSAIVEFALETGFRKSEIINLTWNMFKNGKISIPSRLRKNGEALRVPITQRAQEIIRETHPQRGIYIEIFKYRGKPIKDPASSAWRRALKNLNLNIRFHDLRHTWATRLAEQGVSVQQIAYLGGWKSTRMVEHYTDLNNLDISQIPGYD